MQQAENIMHQRRLSTQRSIRFVFFTVATLVILAIEPFGLSITFGQSSSKHGGVTRIPAASVNAGVRRPISPDDNGISSDFDGTSPPAPPPVVNSDGIGGDESPADLIDETNNFVINQALVSNSVTQAAEQEMDAARSSWRRFLFGMGAVTLMSIVTVRLLSWARNRRRRGGRSV